MNLRGISILVVVSPVIWLMLESLFELTAEKAGEGKGWEEGRALEKGPPSSLWPFFVGRSI